jgi:hypothetical protein
MHHFVSSSGDEIYVALGSDTCWKRGVLHDFWIPISTRPRRWSRASRCYGREAQQFGDGIEIREIGIVGNTSCRDQGDEPNEICAR